MSDICLDKIKKNISTEVCGFRVVCLSITKRALSDSLWFSREVITTYSTAICHPVHHKCPSTGASHPPEVTFKECHYPLLGNLTLRRVTISHLFRSDRQPSGCDVPGHISHDQGYRSLLKRAIDDTLDPRKAQILPDEGSAPWALSIP